MEKSYKMQQIYYPFIIGLSLENRLAAFKECAKLGLAICVRSLLFFNFLVAGKFKHVEKNVHHLLSEKSICEHILAQLARTMWREARTAAANRVAVQTSVPIR